MPRRLVPGKRDVWTPVTWEPWLQLDLPPTETKVIKREPDTLMHCTPIEIHCIEMFSKLFVNLKLRGGLQTNFFLEIVLKIFNL